MNNMSIWVFLALLLSMSSCSDAAYCVCKQGGDDDTYQKTIDYACGTKADCKPILEGGPCYQPDDVKSHCDYAVDSYYANSNKTQDDCNFSGVAALVQALPSTVPSGCSYPGSAGQAGGTGTSTGTSTAPGSSTTGSTTGTGTDTSSIYGPTGLAPTGLGFNNDASALLTSSLQHFTTMAIALFCIMLLWA